MLLQSRLILALDACFCKKLLSMILFENSLFFIDSSRAISMVWAGAAERLYFR